MKAFGPRLNHVELEQAEAAAVWPESSGEVHKTCPNVANLRFSEFINAACLERLAMHFPQLRRIYIEYADDDCLPSLNSLFTSRHFMPLLRCLEIDVFIVDQEEEAGLETLQKVLDDRKCQLLIQQRAS